MRRPWHPADVMGRGAPGYRSYHRDQAMRGAGGRQRFQWDSPFTTGFRYEKPRVPEGLLKNLLAGAFSQARKIVEDPGLVGVKPWMLRPTFIPHWRESQERDRQYRRDRDRRRADRDIDPDTGLPFDMAIPSSSIVRRWPSYDDRYEYE